ncbi:MAG: MFS transporter [Thaumarchaeota archaeon]|nr:MFS transporter [Nitrososphaerota archaeon]MCL5317216.1 MFS transporter [Nitrososphaerota archaeon]
MSRKVLGVTLEIFLLGIVSMLTDISSEMIFSVFSIFFIVVLGASAALLGVVEGLADFAASSLDYLSGFVSDRTGKRKRFAILGYGASAIAKGILIFANSVPVAAFFRVFERFGKSIRGPPRDAWISSIAEKSNRGYAFGVHKALDKMGAIVGPLLAYAFFSVFTQTFDSFRLLFIIALVPAAASTLMLFFLKDKPSQPKERENIFKAYKKLDKRFKRYLIAAAVFSIAYFSFGFLLLKAYVTGFSLADVILLYALFNVSFVIVSAPIGRLGDKIGRSKIIASSYVLYAVMVIGFIFASTKIEIIALFVLFGIFYAIDEGQTKAYISDLEQSKRGTAIGFYNFMTGLIYLPASAIAGFLWLVNPSYAFTFAAAFSLGALVIFLSLQKSDSK